MCFIKTPRLRAARDAGAVQSDIQRMVVKPVILTKGTCKLARITRGGGADGAKLVDVCNWLRALGAAGVALSLRPVPWMAL